MSDENTQMSFVGPELKQKLVSLYSYLRKHLGIQQSPTLIFTKSKENSNNPFGKTGYYDHSNNTIRLYVTDRHDTDILRSFSHEVIHHWQNERGTLKQPGDDSGAHDDHYAQENQWLRKREMEAYLFGNLLFRDWQDENRVGPPKVKPSLPQPLDENIKTNPEVLKQNTKKFVDGLQHTGAISSYHRDLTSGDMNIEDFKTDLYHKIISAIEEWVQTVDNRSNYENQPNMIS